MENFQKFLDKNLPNYFHPISHTQNKDKKIDHKVIVFGPDFLTEMEC